MSYLSAMKKLDEVIVGVGGAATIAFSSIDQTFRSLQLDFQGRSDGSGGSAVNFNLQFNGDTAGNYDYLMNQGDGPTLSWGTGCAAATTSINLANIPASSAAASMPLSQRIVIENYAATTFYKQITADGTFMVGTADSNLYRVIASGQWRSTAAITSILLFPASGGFVAGSVASLYGWT